MTESHEPNDDERAEEAAPAPNEMESVIGRLEAGLRTAVDHLQTMIGDVEALKGEQLAIHEELQSANAELDASKAEVRSATEEVEAVNAQLQARSEDLEKRDERIRALEEASLEKDEQIRALEEANLWKDEEIRALEEARIAEEIATPEEAGAAEAEEIQVPEEVHPEEVHVSEGASAPEEATVVEAEEVPASEEVTVAEAEEVPASEEVTVAEAEPPEPSVVAPPVGGDEQVEEERDLSVQRVLVIEQHAESAEKMRLLLHLVGNEVEVAADGQSGFERARGFRPDVIICDVELSEGMTGYEVAEAVRRDPLLAETYLIALTTYGKGEDRQRANAAGFDARIAKPADPSVLERIVADARQKRT